MYIGFCTKFFRQIFDFPTGTDYAPFVADWSLFAIKGIFHLFFLMIKKLQLVEELTLLLAI